MLPIQPRHALLTALAFLACCGAGRAQEGRSLRPAESFDARTPLGTAWSARERPAPPALVTSLRSLLVGRWEGSDFTLTVDQDAVQANRDPGKPFQWDPLHVLDARENMFVFELGGDRYIALIAGDGMTLTQAGLSGYRSLTRKR